MPDLHHFIEAQAGGVHARAVAELVAGEKRTHWMWFIFPQLAGLGRSETARRYALPDLAAARAYLDHDLLGPRLREAVCALKPWHGRRTATALLGEVDAMKLRSSLTLFEAAGGGAAFADAIDGFFAGARDPETVRLLAMQPPPGLDEATRR